MWVRSDIHINWCEYHKELSELNKLWQNETCVQLFLFCKAMYFLLSVVCFVTRRAVLQTLSPAAGWLRVTTHKNISTPLCPLKTESIALYSCFALFCRAEQPDVVWVGTKINITATCVCPPPASSDNTANLSMLKSSCSSVRRLINWVLKSEISVTLAPNYTQRVNWTGCEMSQTAALQMCVQNMGGETKK